MFADLGLAVPIPALSPAALETRAALAAQSAALAHALDRLERARVRVPARAPSERWRGVAHAAYGASVGSLAGHLDDAIAAVSLARHHTMRAIATMDSRVG